MSVVYFIRRKDATGPVKIGFSKLLGSRLLSLQYEHKADLDVLASVPGSRGDEKRLHRYFADFREEGEWFSYSPEIADVVTFARQNGVLPPLTLKWEGGTSTESDASDSMTLREYFAAGLGDMQTIAEALGVSLHGVRKWVYAQREPSLSDALKIVALTGGHVTVERLALSNRN